MTDIKEIKKLTRLVVTPVPRDTPTHHLSKNSDKRMLTEDFVVEITLESGEVIIIRVPKGYISDGASIPRFFHRIYHPFSTESFWGAVVHDYLYSDLYHRFPKELADKILKKMIEQDNGSWLMQNSFYRAVRLNMNGGGWSK